MPKLVVVRHDGTENILEAAAGQSIMQIVRDAGFDEMMALCGGTCSCATCHVYVDAAWLDRLAAIAAAEEELLESSAYRNSESRLSCQILLDANLDGICVTIAPEE